jgi:hypothetical protein
MRVTSPVTGMDAGAGQIELIWEYSRLHLGLVGGCLSLKGVFK